ncbi:MAG: OmpA family protein [Thiotrichales bacterium]
MVLETQDGALRLERRTVKAAGKRRNSFLLLIVLGVALSMGTQSFAADMAADSDGIFNNPMNDTDGDGLNDSVDFDDDNDGIPDVEEYDPYIDTDCDGIYDALDADNGDCSGSDIKGSGDSDGDSISDAMECPSAPVCVDTDHDGIPNYMDTDDDNDGISTLDEGGMKDTDKDGVWNSLENNNLDTDGDSRFDYRDRNDDNDDWDTALEVGDSVIEPIDADLDLIPDYLDLGIGDGSDRSTVAGSGDSDGDSIADGIECPAGAPCPDHDGDHVPDYMDSDDNNNGVLTIDEDANGDGNPTNDDADGDGKPDYLDQETDTGSSDDGAADNGGSDGSTTDDGTTDGAAAGDGATDNGVTDGGVTGVIDDGGAAASAGGPVISGTGALNPGLLLAGLGGVLIRRKYLSGMIAAALGVATATAQAEGPQWYVGAGLGLTSLKPDASQSDFDVRDDSDHGFKVFAGRELSDHLSVEGFYSNLGEAKLAPYGEIEYKTYGASVQIAIPENNPGISGFVKGGIVKLDADAGDGVPHVTDKDLVLYGGVGAEYQVENGLAVRGEYEHYTKDAQMLSVSVIKRFGGGYEDLTAPEATTDTIALASTALGDADKDGVADMKDGCPATPDGAPVNDKGCPSFIGVVDGIMFEFNSDRLFEGSKVVLSRIAKDMNAYPKMKFVVVGHTDNVGDEAFNQKLSLMRSRAVATYLVSQGVDGDRLRFTGYGESRPRTTNRTPEGRAINRRVEIFSAS